MSHWCVLSILRAVENITYWFMLFIDDIVTLASVDVVSLKCHIGPCCFS